MPVSLVATRFHLVGEVQVGKLAPTWENLHPHGKTCSMFERWHQSEHGFRKLIRLLQNAVAMAVETAKAEDGAAAQARRLRHQLRHQPWYQRGARRHHRRKHHRRIVCRRGGHRGDQQRRGLERLAAAWVPDTILLLTVSQDGLECGRARDSLHPSCRLVRKHRVQAILN